MKKLLILFLVFCQYLNAQQLTTDFLTKVPLNAHTFVGVDTFGAQYFINGKVFYKNDGLTIREFTDFRLGPITHADILNPLKVILFYQNANVAVILDNKLSEIKRINFNELEPFRLVGYVGTAGQNNIWVFNIDQQRIEIWGENRQRNMLHTPPIQGKIIGFESNYNYCWVYTTTHLKKYNIYGVLVEDLPISNISKVHQDNGDLIFLKEGKLKFLGKKSLIPIDVQIPDFAVEQFSFNTEMLYIYSDQTVYQFKTVQPKK